MSTCKVHQNDAKTREAKTETTQFRGSKSLIWPKFTFFQISFDEDVHIRSKTDIPLHVAKKRPRAEKQQKKVPSKFIQHIVGLGFDEKDAPRLYANKKDWTGVAGDSKILCTAQGCKEWDFLTTLISRMK